ncbi:MAG: sigma 54-dependent Fis family transcriptional regulator [Deltaproteobacteria bacterium]|nr:sigma 54-dependent Fis family transcriptional regulator [Deltaproteobacteria bacterium]
MGRRDEADEPGGSDAKTEKYCLPDDAPSEIGCILYVSSPEGQAQSHALESGQAVIGRDEDCDLVIEDESISRRHARLIAGPGGILVEDLGSTNGVLYMGKRIERATLKPGVRIELGRCTVDILPLPDGRSIQPSRRDSYAGLVGASLPMRRLFAILELLEPSEVPVLIEGETGTGKELVARAIHDRSPRAGKPFVVIDCTSVPPDLMESELFGHRKGSFTGAVADRTGAFEAASGGTVFLDELGELPLELQPKLLRVLETGEVKRVGDVQQSAVDVRVIAATNRDLAEEVEQGRFRDDLFYRLAVVHLQLPPLREHREDIPLLVDHICGQDRGRHRLPPEADEILLQHDWPGNVRELRNVIQRALALGIVSTGPKSETIFSSDRGRFAPGGESESSPISAPFREAREQAIQEFERRYLHELWTRMHGNLSAAAREAGIDRKYFRQLLKKYGLY